MAESQFVRDYEPVQATALDERFNKIPSHAKCCPQGGALSPSSLWKIGVITKDIYAILGEISTWVRREIDHQFPGLIHAVTEGIKMSHNPIVLDPFIGKNDSAKQAESP